MAERFYIGIDVHKKSWTVSCIHHGELLFRHRQEPSVDVLVRILDRHGATPPLTGIVYEAGPTGFWLHDELTALGYAVIVVSPSLVPRAPGQRVKTDSVDSRGLAIKLAGGILQGIAVPSVEQRAIRDLVRTRRQLVRQRAALLHMMKSKLLFLNLPYPTGRWGPAARRGLKDLVMRDEHRLALDHIVEAIEDLTDRIQAMETDIEGVFSTEDQRTKRILLESIPGIGPRCSRVLLAELGDIQRFPTADHLASYLGLTPAEYSSGDSIRRGSITRQGNGHIRALLVEAAWTAIRKDPIRRQFYVRLAARMGGKKAIVAVARKLAIIIHRMLSTGEVYRWEEAR